MALDGTAAHRPRTPTTNGIPSALKMIAACEVLPPCSAAKALRPERDTCKASIADSVEPIPMVPGAAALGNSSGKPRRLRRSRSPIASTSAPRSRRYGSSIRSNFARIASVTRRTADSAAISSFSINRRVPSTIASSRSIRRCASTMRCPSCSCSVSRRAERDASCASVVVTASRRRAISTGTRSREIRRSTTDTRGTSTRACPMAIPSDAAIPVSVVPVAIPFPGSSVNAPHVASGRRRRGDTA